MLLSKLLVRKYKRWRHGRGFGIHSPFAYDFITLTLRERLPYYGYGALDDAAIGSHRDNAISTDRLRLIFRVSVRFRPDSAAILGKSNAKAEQHAIALASPSTNLITDHQKAGMIIVNSYDRPLCADAGSSGRRVYIFPDTKSAGTASACERLWDNVIHGMRFDNGKDMTIIVISPHLPRQSFEVKF